MELTLKRNPTRDTYTSGTLYNGAQKLCYTLEDAVRARKIKGQTAIPSGRYRVAITPSQRFKQRMPLLLNVPEFEGIRIHPGNTDKDTSGCILVGFERAGATISRSREAYRALFDVLDEVLERGEAVWLTIINAPGDPAWHSVASATPHQTQPKANPRLPVVVPTGGARPPQATAAVSEGMPKPPPIPATPNQATHFGLADNWLGYLRKALPLTSLFTSGASSFLLQYRWPLLAFAACAFCFWLGWHLRSPKEGNQS